MIPYGTQAQGKLLSFSQTMLEHVQKKDIGEVGEIISDLMKQLNEVNPDELKDEKPSFFAGCLEKFRVASRGSFQISKNRGTN